MISMISLSFSDRCLFLGEAIALQRVQAERRESESEKSDEILASNLTTYACNVCAIAHKIQL